MALHILAGQKTRRNLPGVGARHNLIYLPAYDPESPSQRSGWRLSDSLLSHRHRRSAPNRELIVSGSLTSYKAFDASRHLWPAQSKSTRRFR